MCVVAFSQQFFLEPSDLMFFLEINSDLLQIFLKLQLLKYIKFTLTEQRNMEIQGKKYQMVKISAFFGRNQMICMLELQLSGIHQTVVQPLMPLLLTPNVSQPFTVP